MSLKENVHFKESNDFSEKTVSIRGYFKGNIISNNTIYISDTGKIEGDIEADDIIVFGKILGNVLAKNKIYFASSSKFEGIIKAKKLIIDKGALFLGKCSMEN